MIIFIKYFEYIYNYYKKKTMPCVTNLFLFLVVEKESKFKNILIVMGLKKHMFLISWVILY